MSNRWLAHESSQFQVALYLRIEIICLLGFYKCLNGSLYLFVVPLSHLGFLGARKMRRTMQEVGGWRKLPARQGMPHGLRNDFPPVPA